MKLFVPLLLFFCCTYYLQSQDSEEIRELKICTSELSDSLYHGYDEEENNHMNSSFNRAFRFYKKYISSQDHGNCSFTPSCSEYAIIAIRKQGILTGLVNALDRLTRCNGRNKRNYPVDASTGLLIDEVRNLRYEKE